MEIPGLSTKALKYKYNENRLKYNGKEMQEKEFADTTGLNWEDYGARMYDPQIGRFNSVDPMSQKTFELSVYSYGKNNPVINVDIEGKFSISFHKLFTEFALGQMGYSRQTQDLVGHYASTYADNPHLKGITKSGAITMAEGGAYRKGIDYSGTNNSQDTKSILYSTWHSMKADGESVSDAYAMARGQEFGWGKIFDAAEEIKKAGGIDDLKANSKGIQELGQGVHALQDAIAHQGEDYAHHNLKNDMFPSSNTMNLAVNVTTSALVVAEVMSGDYSHVKDGATINVSGMTTGQLTSFLQNLNNGMSKNQNNKITINMN